MSKLLTKEKEITAWLDKYQVDSYTLIEDVQYGYLIDVEGDVYLSHKKLTHIVVQFGRVSGTFNCGGNQLTSLKGSPASIDGDFYCYSNQLTSLEGGPTSVGGQFNCQNNQLASLEGCAISVGGYFYCENNESLGEYQKITDFNVIKEKIISDKEKALLSSSLLIPKKFLLQKL